MRDTEETFSGDSVAAVLGCGAQAIELVPTAGWAGGHPRGTTLS